MENSIQTHIQSDRDARFLTNYCNYDQGWPPVPVQPEKSICDDLTNNQDYASTMIAHLSSINSKSARYSQLLNLISSKKVVLELKKYADFCKQSALFRSHQLKRLGKSAELERRELDFQLEWMNSQFSSKLNEAVEKQNSYIHEWNSQRLGCLNQMEDDRITLRLGEEDNTCKSGLYDQPVALVGANKRRNQFGQLILTNLEVVSTQRDDARKIAQIAAAAMYPFALISSLLYNLHVDRILHMDLAELRSEYALDWNGNSRDLFLLGGVHGDVLATIHITPDGSVTLTNVRHEPCANESVSLSNGEVASINSKMLSKLNEFIPPMSRSLKEWVSEVADFCISLSDTLI